MKLDALDHPKTLDFASRLGITRPTAIGHLELLWAFTGKYAAQGNIGKQPDGAIARGCDWMGSADEFVRALIESGLLDADPTHRLIVHDWEEHAPRWVKSKLKTLNLTFVHCESEPVEAAVSPDTSADTSPPSKGSVVKGREGKCSEGNPTPAQNGTASGSQSDDREAFERAKAAYPGGTYRANAWLLGQRNFWRLLDGIATAPELIAAAVGYREQQEAAGKVGSQFVLAPDKFFDPALDHWRGPFPKPLGTKSQSEVFREFREEFARGDDARN